MTNKTATGGTLRDDERIMAVIEAAEAAMPDLRGFLNRHYEVFGTSFTHPFERIVDAVEALQAAEGEE